MLLKMNRHTIIYSMYRVDALRTPSRLRAGYPTLLQWRGSYDFYQAQDQPHGYHTSVLVIECFLSRSMLFLKCINILFTVIFCSHAQYQKRYNRLITPLVFFLAHLRFVEFCHTQCPCINGARLSDLHMVQLYM